MAVGAAFAMDDRQRVRAGFAVAAASAASGIDARRILGSGKRRVEVDARSVVVLLLKQRARLTHGEISKFVFGRASATCAAQMAHRAIDRPEIGRLLEDADRLMRAMLRVYDSDLALVVDEVHGEAIDEHRRAAGGDA
jgi:hypothetical protein